MKERLFQARQQLEKFGRSLFTWGDDDLCSINWNAAHRVLETRPMNFEAFYRREAEKYRELAKAAEDPVIKREMLEPSEICEEVANEIEDRMTAG
jgi:hypothetical protein